MQGLISVLLHHCFCRVALAQARSSFGSLLIAHTLSIWKTSASSLKTLRPKHRLLSETFRPKYCLQCRKSAVQLAALSFSKQLDQSAGKLGQRLSRTQWREVGPRQEQEVSSSFARLQWKFVGHFQSLYQLSTDSSAEPESCVLH